MWLAVYSIIPNTYSTPDHSYKSRNVAFSGLGQQTWELGSQEQQNVSELLVFWFAAYKITVYEVNLYDDH